MLTYKSTQIEHRTTLNDIKPGTVFEGDVDFSTDTSISPQYRMIISAIWLRTGGPNSRHSVMAIALTKSNNYGLPIVAISCLPVYNYRELKNPEIVERD